MGRFVIFKANGHTVADYDKRFDIEDKGIIGKNDGFFLEVS